MKIVCCAAAERELVPASLRRFSVRTGIPVFASRYGAFLLQSRIIGILREKGDRRLTVHGVLVALDRRGVLMTGESGSGKTVSGLALAAAGARWVADDAVALERRGDAVYGRGHERTRHLIALREQGIVRVDRWLGEGVLIPEARVDLIMELDRGPLREEFRRQSREILGIQIPCLYLKDDSGPSGIVERITAFFDGNPSVAATNG
jgi:HPr kinase/phosphorylase